MWKQKLKKIGVLWQHDGDMNKPHALWTSGRHADTFNNGSMLLENPIILEKVCTGIIENMREKIDEYKPDYIVGPAFGAVTLGSEIARQLGIKFAFTEPVQTNEGKKQELKRFDIPKGTKVLVVEDAISTGGSIKKTINVLENLGVNVLPFVGTIVNWSGSDTFSNRKIYSLFSVQPRSWTEEECELCKGGSKALRPKANWSLFSE